MTIPIAAPDRWFTAHQADVHRIFSEVCRAGHYILGPEVAEFETRFAGFCQARHAIAVASGTDALSLALQALDVAGGEVVTSAHTAVATIAAIQMAGAAPVLADIDPVSHCLDPDSVATLVSHRTRAVVAVHIFGHPADMHRLGRLVNGTGIALVEDCAQAHGARLDGQPVGNLGDAGAFSFYPTKTLGAMGDAGAVVSNSDELAGKLSGLRQYGWDAQRLSQYDGRNSRMDAVQAAILSFRLSGFDKHFERRQAIARRYDEALAAQPLIDAPVALPGVTHGYHQYVVQCAERDALRAALSDAGIQCALHYPCPVHAHPAYRKLRRAESLARVEALYGRMLSIPIYPELRDAEVEIICCALAAWPGGGT